MDNEDNNNPFKVKPAPSTLLDLSLDNLYISGISNASWLILWSANFNTNTNIINNWISLLRPLSIRKAIIVYQLEGDLNVTVGFDVFKQGTGVVYTYSGTMSVQGTSGSYDVTETVQDFIEAVRTNDIDGYPRMTVSNITVPAYAMITIYGYLDFEYGIPEPTGTLIF